MKKGNIFIKVVVVVAALSLLAVALAPIVPLLIPPVNGPEQELLPLDPDLDEITEKLLDEFELEPGDEASADPNDAVVEELTE